MEATKKTTATRAALLVVAALSMLLSGLFVATAARSDASPPPACPDGFALTADQKNCFQNAVQTSADNPNTCAEGLITPDGTKCYIAARVIPQEGTTECPKGYSPDDSLGGMCARFEAASLGLPACPDGARGVVGSCYILVAKGPAGTADCSAVINPAAPDDAPLEGVLVGETCQVTGNPPVLGNFSCPANGTTIFGNSADCYSIQTPQTATNACPGAPFQMVDNICKWIFPTAQLVGSETFDCTTHGVAGIAANEVTLITTEVLGHTKGLFCQFTGAVVTSCAAGVEAIVANGVVTGCKIKVDLVAGGSSCLQAGYSKIGATCVLIVSLGTTSAQCPTGTSSDNDGCRRYVADAKGAYYCKDAAAALNGKNCVFTAPFTVDFAETAYKCDTGTRAVVGDQVLCFLGDADDNVDPGVSCLQGVLSTDNLYCIVPRIDTAPAAVAAPVPSFTG